MIMLSGFCCCFFVCVCVHVCVCANEFTNENGMQREQPQRQEKKITSVPLPVNNINEYIRIPQIKSMHQSLSKPNKQKAAETLSNKNKNSNGLIKSHSIHSYDNR